MSNVRFPDGTVLDSWFLLYCANPYNHTCKRGRQASTGVWATDGCHAGLLYAAR